MAAAAPHSQWLRYATPSPIWWSVGVQEGLQHSLPSLAVGGGGVQQRGGPRGEGAAGSLRSLGSVSAALLGSSIGLTLSRQHRPSRSPSRWWRRQRRRGRRRLRMAAMDFGMDPPPFCPAPEPPDVSPPDYDFGDFDPYDPYSLDSLYGGYGAGGLQPDPETLDAYRQSYNAKMSEHAWLGDCEAALDVMHEMRNMGVQPDVISYRVAIYACRLCGNWEKAVDLIEELWDKDLTPDVQCYTAAIGACAEAAAEEGDERAAEMAAKLRSELLEWGSAPEAVRFHGTPAMKWNRQVKRFGCGCRSLLNWKSGDNVPLAPSDRPCWFLPNQDEVAVQVAIHQNAIRRAGWKVLSCHPDVVESLCNKDLMRKRAMRLGLGASVPAHFEDVHEARYPCILKPAIGTFGKDTHVVYNAEEVIGIVRSENLSPRWLLQELIPGRLEHSTTLLVFQGEVYDYVNTLYEYDGEEFVWPRVEEVRHEYTSVPEERLKIFETLLTGFSGICCLGYKERADGSIGIYDVNPRLGGDLVFDIPKPRARAMLEKMDALFS
eukprot:TRINITY_DN65095_c0_g1_i3.p1 TRINITY_DN65095_c0_g1~~TRINITY_DN65095_c0_g1_i3.p1  ORF type:complete len:546 (-),score=106.52 TRINITY_DN65095_c0_g1_i3:17-1654(-)